VAPRAEFQPPTPQQIEAIIVQGDAKALVESAQRLGASLAQRGLTTSQIRGVFGTVRQIQMKWQGSAGDGEARAALRQLLLLKPKLAYQASRDSDRTGAVNDLQRVLVPAIDLVATREQFNHLVDYFEAILAYHKAAGGKDDDRRR
jgi:CRISPR-associated protein Csm2